ncbi:MAG: dephospho-CoA kinase [Erysipelotrichaceae bacterium]
MSALSTKMKKIAITGSIGSGKSATRLILERLGYPVVDADQLNDQLLREPAIQQQIQALFGKEAVVDQVVDRAFVRAKMLEDPRNRVALEQLMHPLIKARMLAFMEQANASIVFAEVPLLFESGWQDLFDEVWTLYVAQEVLLQRLVANRNLSLAQAQALLAIQMNQSEKVKRAHRVLPNEGTLQDLEQRILAYILEVSNESG